MKIFISGGCKNGKSSIAEDQAVKLAVRENPGTKKHDSENPGAKNHDSENSDGKNNERDKLYYIATMIPHDDEDHLRIDNHRKMRAGKGFTTIECGHDILSINPDPDGTFLLDSVTALLSNEMFKTSDGKNFDFDEGAADRVAHELIEFSNKVKNIVFVSDYIAADICYEELTEKYRKGLALLDKALAKACDTVCEITLGNPYIYKGELL